MEISQSFVAFSEYMNFTLFGLQFRPPNLKDEYGDAQFVRLGLSKSLEINMSGSDNYTISIGIQNLSQLFENPIPASLFILLIVLGILGKFFTYVTKTRSNLYTYSRKPGNYNDTIIFEIDIMKKSSPINLKFTFLPLSKPKWHFFSGAVS